MTAEVKDELSRLVVSSVSARRAEVTSLLRFAGGLHIVAGRVVVEAEVDLGSIARRLRKDIFDLYGYNAVVHVLSASGIRKTTRYVLRVANDGEALARQTGLLDLRGRPVRGLPAQVVGGSIGDAEAAWRGAFLAHGSLTEPGRSSALEVSCPGPEAALALVGAARRLGISAKAREVRGADRVVVRDGEAIGALLTRMGAQDTRLVWEERRMRREVRATANRLRISTTPTCGARPVPRWRPPPASNGRWKFSVTVCPNTWPPRASCVSSTGRRHWRNWAGWPIRR